MKNITKVHRSYDAEVVESVTCDICKKTYQGEDWEAHLYDVRKVEVSYREGEQYPEGGWGTKMYFDICPTCFTGRLVPALQALGAEPTMEHWDW